MAFNPTQFTSTFDATLVKLATSERITKDTLQVLSRDLLSLLHTKNDKTGDIGYINRTIQVLTPINRKVFIAFNKEFTGFILNKSGESFDKKSKQHYDDVQAKAIEWLDDPMNNIWSWADRNIEIVPKDFTLDVVKDSVSTLFKKADKRGFKRTDVIKAIFDAGITMQELVDMLGENELLNDAMQVIDHDYSVSVK